MNYEGDQTITNYRCFIISINNSKVLVVTQATEECHIIYINFRSAKIFSLNNETSSKSYLVLNILMISQSGASWTWPTISPSRHLTCPPMLMNPVLHCTVIGVPWNTGSLGSVDDRFWLSSVQPPENFVMFKCQTYYDLMVWPVALKPSHLLMSTWESKIWLVAWIHRFPGIWSQRLSPQLLHRIWICYKSNCFSYWKIYIYSSTHYTRPQLQLL